MSDEQVMKGFTCSTCMKNFSTKFNLKQHFATHSDVKLYVCEICQRGFNQRSNLRRHRLLHKDDSSMDNEMKDVQSAVLASKDELAAMDINASPQDIPSKFQDQGRKLMICETCGMNFSSNFNLKRHLKTHLKERLYTCTTCGKTFGQKSNMKRHEITHMDEDVSMLKCEQCDQVFTRKDNLRQHIKLHQELRCNECDAMFTRKFELSYHKRVKHSRVSLKSVKPKKTLSNEKAARTKQVQSDALNVFKTFMFYPNESDARDINVLQTSLQTEIEDTLLLEIQEKSAIKWYMVLKATLERETIEGEHEEIQSYFRCQCFTELMEETIPQHVNEGYSKIIKSFEDFIQRGSGWQLQRIHHLELKIAKYHPLAASSYIPLPKKILDKKAVLNIQNKDNKCLIWCLLAHRMNIDRKRDPQRLHHYAPYERDIKIDGISFPVPVTKIPVIEQLNDLRINVFGYEDEEVCPLYVSERDEDDVINLLLISDGEKHHYCLIRNFSRLMGDVTKHDGVAHYCYRCLHRFSRKDLLVNHTRYCREHMWQAVRMPDESNNLLTFTGIHMQHPVAFTIYADFESLLVPISSVSPSDKTSYTEKMHHHIPCGYAYVIVGPDGKSLKPVKVYRGEDCVEHFLENMIREKEELGRKLLNIKPLKLTSDEEKAFQEATFCSICTKPLTTQRARDHNHLTGAYRGAAHIECNLNYKQSKTIPVIFHNLKNYDGHHIMTQIGKYKDHQIDVIASTLENYIMFRIKKFKSPIQMIFLDSFQFLPTSLEKLVNNLKADDFNILKENFPSDIDLSLLTRKGVYPYDYFTCMEKFKEKQLPPPSAFFNQLTDEPITDEDYQHAHTIWKVFHLKYLGEYHDLYVKTDVLLLADVFQNFRSLCLQYYDIDCAHLFTAPSLAWQACLKMTETPLELLTDVNMLLMIENGIRGGISMISRRYAKANIPGTPEYDNKEAINYLMYWDANNLYGWAMSQYLPYGKFEWYSTQFITEEWILSLSDTSDDGYIFEVDLEYPMHLHHLHNEYPVAPERVTVTEEMLSPYSKSLLHNRKFVGTPKLIPNLNPKKHYITHYRNLKLYLQLGLKVTFVHKALKFRQSPWLRKYIQFNTEKRKEATSSFEKDFFKLMNNSVYGKTMENLRRRRNIELCNVEKRAKKLVASPTFKSFKTFNCDLTAVERQKTSILMNRPIYVGFTILELSKLHMYDFHYNHVKKTYQDQAILLFTDTDSLTYQITTQDIMKDMKQYASLFDFSDYPKHHPLYSEENKKIIGKFKDELNGELAIEFVGLKSKMYSLKSVASEKKRAKGVSTRVVRKKIKHADYLECLQQHKTSMEKQIRIAQDRHNLYTLAQNKISLSPFDDKRYISSDGITSFAYGHYKIKQECAAEEMDVL